MLVSLKDEMDCESENGVEMICVCHNLESDLFDDEVASEIFCRYCFVMMEVSDCIDVHVYEEVNDLFCCVGNVSENENALFEILLYGILFWIRIFLLNWMNIMSCTFDCVSHLYRAS